MFCFVDDIAHLVDGEDALGDEAVCGVVGESLAGGDGGPVLPHDPLGRLHHPGHHALQLQPGAGVDVELRPRRDVHLGLSCHFHYTKAYPLTQSLTHTQIKHVSIRLKF